jgi:CRISPR system Cascade subunit CasE
MTLWLSRVRIARGADLDALRPLLDPGALHQGARDPHERGKRTDAHHRLIWTLFADSHDRRRDFLWRDEGAGRFTLLSHRQPTASRVFDEPEIKPFAPVLAAGDRLAFAMRVNATRDLAGKEKGRRVDVVMHALYGLAPAVRADARMKLAQVAATAWMAGQEGQGGFVANEVSVSGYSVAALPGYMGRRMRQPQYGVLDLTGVLTVVDPAAFTARLGRGFGRARSFGCGLMMIRRV